MAKHKSFNHQRIYKRWQLKQNLYKISLWGKKGNRARVEGSWVFSHLHIDIDLVDVQPSAGVLFSGPLFFFPHTHTCTQTLETKTYRQEASLLSLDPSPFRFVLYTPGATAVAPSVAHLLRQLVGVEDSGHWHLELVFLLLGLTQRRLPLLQKQVCRILAGKLLQDHTRRGFRLQSPATMFPQSETCTAQSLHSIIKIIWCRLQFSL